MSDANAKSRNNPEADADNADMRLSSDVSVNSRVKLDANLDPRPRPKQTNRPDSTTARRTRMLRKIKIEDDYLRKLAEEIMAEKRRLCKKREELALALREKEQAEGN